MQISRRAWWVVGAILAVGIFAILAAIAGNGSPGGEGAQLAPGESEILRARVVEVLEEGQLDQGDISQSYQLLSLEVTSGSLEGQELTVEYGSLVFTNEARLFQEGDRVLVERTRTMEGSDVFHVTDYVRSGPLLWLTLFFVVATVLLSGWQGLRSLMGMGVSMVVIVTFIVPQILAGQNPVVVAVLGSVVMMGISLYLVYGWNSKTHVAVGGLLLSLIVTGILAVWAVNWTRLSGYGAEEAGFLQVAGVQLDTRGLLLA
ncbi:MAG: YibE/F family protein, partial [Anaerolineae bacterium]